MDPETLVRIAPLVSGPLLNKRNEIKEQVVKATLARAVVETDFSIQDLSGAVERLFGVRFDEPTIVACLERLQSEGTVAYLRGRTYRLKVQVQIPQLSSVFSRAWGEFSANLAKRYKDFDPHWTDAGARSLFEQIILNVFAEVAQSAEYLSNQIELLGRSDILSISEEKLKSSQFTNPKAFSDTLADYFAKPTPILLDLFTDIYSGLINFDILRREEILPAVHIEASFQNLLLDTNVLAALLTPSDRLHLLASVICRRSVAMGLKLSYSSATIEEMRALVTGSIREMSTVRAGEDDEVVRSQFVVDYVESGLEWEEYARGLENWQQTLRLIWNVEQEAASVVPDVAVTTFAKSIIPEMSRLREQDRARRHREYLTRERRSMAIEHDAAVLGQIATLRSNLAPTNAGPIFLTFDNVIAAASEAIRNQFGWSVGPAIQPRSWLNYIIAFSPAEIDAERRREAAKALIGLMSWPSRGKLSIEEYARLLAPKLGLRSTDADVLISAFANSPLRDDLESALETDRGSAAEQIAQKIFTDRDYIETLVGGKRKVEVIQKLRSRLDVAEAENRRLRQERESIVSPTVVVNITNAPTATSAAIATATTEQSLESLIRQLRTTFPEGLVAAGLPEPPLSQDDKAAVRGWLTKLIHTATATGNILDRMANLLPLASLVLSHLH